MWYENPTVAAILGAAAGAMLTGLVSYFIAFRTVNRQAELNKKKRRIECFIRQATSLMSFSDAIKDQIQVTIDGQVVSSVHLFKLDVVNTGTEPIRNQPIHLRFGANTKILSHTVTTDPAVGFGGTDDRIVEDGLDLFIDLMNPEDVVSISMMTHDNPMGTIDVFMKNEGVNTAVHTSEKGSLSVESLLSSQGLSSAALLGSFPLIGWMFRGIAQYALLQKLDDLSRDFKRIARHR